MKDPRREELLESLGDSKFPRLCVCVTYGTQNVPTEPHTEKPNTWEWTRLGQERMRCLNVHRRVYACTHTGTCKIFKPRN